MSKDIYISTVAFSGMEIEKIVALAIENDLNLEFSSGLQYRVDMENKFVESPVKRIPHNYFPAPLHPFVLNLASKDPDIRNKSVAMCKKGLELAAKAGSPFYAAHAGFCIDPAPAELGAQLKINNNYNRETNWQIFKNSVQEILTIAHELQIDFLIENNVIAQFNLGKGGTNPLLCCESSEIEQLMKDINDPKLGILLDTAHLKVSCVSLGLDPGKELDKIAQFVKAFHHSDNDGAIDNNQPIDDNYWCKTQLSGFTNLTHVIEVKSLSIPEIQNQINLLKQFLTYSYAS